MQYHYDTVVIGGGQAGLAMGYYLARQNRDFVILDGGTSIGEAWRSRWDSLKLFTPAQHSSLLSGTSLAAYPRLCTARLGGTRRGVSLGGHAGTDTCAESSRRATTGQGEATASIDTGLHRSEL